MTTRKYLSRDFLTLPGCSTAGTMMYVMSIFLRHVLSFEIIGQTNFDLDGTYEIISAPSASINLGLGNEYHVRIPSAFHTVTSDDVDRILVLRSENWPRHNSGLFRISSVITGTNDVVIDYRSNEFPPPETDANFAIFESENTISSSWRNTPNTDVSGYRSRNNSDCSRVIFQTAEELSSYQIRLCLENSASFTDHLMPPLTITPGYEGLSNGDFDIGTNHLHTHLFHNSQDSKYNGLTIGLGESSGNSWVNDQFRMSVIGDPLRGTIGYQIREVGGTVQTNWGAVGVPDDERPTEELIQHVAEEQIFRLFAIGSARPNITNTWNFDFHDRAVHNGVAWSNDIGMTVPCTPSLYHPVQNYSSQGTDVNLHEIPQATDNPWTGKTDLHGAELLAGLFNDPQGYKTLDPLYSEFIPSRLGNLPFFRQGRQNFGDWTAGVGGHFPSSSWLHSTNGVFMEWGGPLPSDVVTGSQVYLLPVSTLSSSNGFMLTNPVLPGEDPEIDTIEFDKDIDSVRYRKTYSYFRQEPRNIDFIKAGSNPSKS
jgi:hypothetical protein